MGKNNNKEGKNNNKMGMCKECDKEMRKDTIIRHKCKGKRTTQEPIPQRKREHQDAEEKEEMEMIMGKRFSSPAPYPLSLKRIKRTHRQERDSEEEERAKRIFKQLEPDSDWNSSKEDTENYTAKR